ncbi:helix-turn-helix domain-containing protein [Nocardia sp. NPDC056000]|uniref:helix-turn-helix domain-containing protein n=1 Tax=Nocardia sp. NPDC056000 TaxID=3345674 RepID=UPI0035E07777
MPSNAIGDSLGARVRRARLSRELSVADLGALGDWPESWVREVEADRLTPDRYSSIDRLADLLGTDIPWLLGQPYRSAEPARDAGYGAVPALRTALCRTDLMLSGHRRISAVAEPVPMDALRAGVFRVVRDRQAASLRAVMVELPRLVEDLNTGALDAADTAELDGIHRLIIETSQVARMALNKLGFHDLAWTAAGNAAAAAARLGDPLMLAVAAWDRCGVLLHSGALRQVRVVAEAALDDLRPGLSSPDPQALSLFGALNLRCAVAAARGADAASAWEYLGEADRAATRLGVQRNDFQTVFGPGNVAIHAVEIAVELDQPDVALRRSADFDLTSVPSKERHSRHRIDVARAYAHIGDDASAVMTLRIAADDAPQYVYGHPLARGLVENLLRRARRSSFDAGLVGIKNEMGLE